MLREKSKLKILLLVTLVVIISGLLVVYAVIYKDMGFSQKIIVLDEEETNETGIKSIKEIESDIPGNIDFFADNQLIFESKEPDELSKYTFYLESPESIGCSSGSSGSKILEFDVEDEILTEINESDKNDTQQICNTSNTLQKNKILFKQNNQNSTWAMHLYDVQSKNVTPLKASGILGSYFIEEYNLSNNGHFAIWTRRKVDDSLKYHKPLYHIYIYNFETNTTQNYVFEEKDDRFNDIYNIQVSDDGTKVFISGIKVLDYDSDKPLSIYLYEIDLTKDILEAKQLNDSSIDYFGTFFLLNSGKNIIYSAYSHESKTSGLYWMNVKNKTNNVLVNNILDYDINSSGTTIIYTKSSDASMFQFTNTELFIANLSKKGTILNEQRLYTVGENQYIEKVLINGKGNKIIISVFDLIEESENNLVSEKRHIYVIELDNN